MSGDMCDMSGDRDGLIDFRFRIDAADVDRVIVYSLSNKHP
jgi:hypothetical protein